MLEVSIHRVLIEADHQIYVITVGTNLAVTATDCKERMSTADDRLVGVVGVHVNSSTSK